MNWINVKDKLPELHEYVLCTNGEIINIGKLIKIDGYIFYNPDWHGSEKMTHWMPLPEFPKKTNLINKILENEN